MPAGLQERRKNYSLHRKYYLFLCFFGLTYDYPSTRYLSFFSKSRTKYLFKPWSLWLAVITLYTFVDWTRVLPIVVGNNFLHGVLSLFVDFSTCQKQHFFVFLCACVEREREPLWRSWSLGGLASITTNKKTIIYIDNKHVFISIENHPKEQSVEAIRLINMSFGTKSSYQHKSSATRMDIKWGKKDFSLRKKKSNFDEAIQEVYVYRYHDDFYRLFDHHHALLASMHSMIHDFLSRIQA